MTHSHAAATLDDIVPGPVLQDLADCLTRLARLPIFFARPDGHVLTRLAHTPAVCARVTADDPVSRPCLACARTTWGLDGSGWPDDPDVGQRHRCPSGLSDVVLPVRSGGRVVALIGTPQVALGLDGYEHARSALVQAGVALAEVERFVAHVEIHDAARLDDVRASVRAIAELVVTLGGDALEARAASEHLAVLARTDALTGLENRRQADRELEVAWGLAKRGGRPFGVLLLDVDHFKRVNDTCGHAAGDQVLVALAALLSRSLRRTDRCFRFGGEEFLVVCHESDGPGVLKAAERIRAAVSHTRFPIGDLPPLTVSAGVAAWPDCRAERPDDLLRRADAALYAAKGAGRNCVRAAGG